MACVVKLTTSAYLKEAVAGFLLWFSLSKANNGGLKVFEVILRKIPVEITLYYAIPR